MTRQPEIWIENTGAHGKHIALNTKVYLCQFDESGAKERLDISNLIRKVDVRLHMGEPVTAKLECFITGVKTRADLEELVLKELNIPRKGIRRRLRDITTFGSRGQKEFA